MKSYSNYLALFFCVFSCLPVFAQQTFNVSDAAPGNSEGLSFGYNIDTEKEKAVGDKGDFSRFSLQFFVTNTSSQAKIILFKPGFTLGGNDASPTLVLFRCLNATGARLTTKEAQLQAKACNVLASVEDKDCSSNKTTQSKRFVQIGYWIKAGETISTKAIVIVPLNEKPSVQATLFSNGAQVGSVMPLNTFDQNNQTNQVRQSSPFGENFLRLKNFATNTYLNNQNGPLACTNVKNDWWSKDWQILPVSGTNFYVIKNRWKESFISTDNGTLLSTNSQSSNAMWLVEPIGNTNTYLVKNAANNNLLVNQNGNIQVIQSFGDQQNAKWIIEQ